MRKYARMRGVSVNPIWMGEKGAVFGACRRARVTMGALALFSVASLAHADDTLPATRDWSNMFTFSGFGTLGVTHSSLDTADYTTGYFQNKGAGFSSRYNLSDDTKVGAQVNVQFTSKLSAVIQVISQEGYNNSYAPSLEWANIKYAFTPDFSVRVGRIALPSFLSGDYRNVGYANPWAHVPIETYSLLPVTNSDGADASYKLHFGKLDNTIQVLYGRTTAHVPNPTGPVKLTGSNIFGVFDTVERGALTARIGYEQAHIALGPLPEMPLTFYSVGVDYDPGNWFVQGEWSHAKVPGLTPGYQSWYVIGGYCIKKFTPYVMYSSKHSLGGSTVTSSSDQGQRDYSVGVRWDVYKNMALKLQYDRVVLSDNSAGLFINQQANFAFGSSANVVSAVLDFVF